MVWFENSAMISRDLVAFSLLLSYVTTTYISSWYLFTYWCYLCDIIWRDTIYFSIAAVTTTYEVVSLCDDRREL